jgi:hypothetical protein
MPACFGFDFESPPVATQHPTNLFVNRQSFMSADKTNESLTAMLSGVAEFYEFPSVHRLPLSMRKAARLFIIISPSGGAVRAATVRKDVMGLAIPGVFEVTENWGS